MNVRRNPSTPESVFFPEQNAAKILSILSIFLAKKVTRRYDVTVRKIREVPQIDVTSIFLSHTYDMCVPGFARSRLP